ncbi:MAG: site-2 protease family protein [Candidatus Hodarchaeota archaeon]
MDLLLFFLSIGCIWVMLYILSRRIWIRIQNPEIGLGYALFRSRRLNNLLFRLGNIRVVRILAPVVFDIGILTALSFLVLSILLLSINSVFFFVKTESAVELTPVIPGITISFQSLPYLLIALLIAAGCHELAHAIAAITENKTVKSTGIFILVVLIAFFVELDEKELLEKEYRSKLRIFSAGVLSNLILTIFIFCLLLPPVFQIINAPFYDNDPSGAMILSVVPESPANLAGMQEGWVIVKLEIFDGEFGGTSNISQINNQLDLSYALMNITVNQNITIFFLHTQVNITTDLHPEMPAESNHGFIGITYWDYYAPRNILGFYLPPILKYHAILILIWSFTINFGLAVFNLLPISLLDGGKILTAIVHSVIKDDIKAKNIIKYSQIGALGLLFLNIALTIVFFGINPY